MNWKRSIIHCPVNRTGKDVSFTEEFYILAVDMGICLSFNVDMVKVDKFLIWWISADAQI